MTEQTAVDKQRHSDLVKALRGGAPEAFAKFIDFDSAALRGPDKVIPRKYTELMAIAVALTTQCEGCIEGHSAAAKAEGASEQEIAETVFIATALRAGAGFVHGLKALDAFRGNE